MNTHDNPPAITDDTSEDVTTLTGATEPQGDVESTAPTTSSGKVVRREKVITPQSFIDFVRHYGNVETIVFLDVKNGKAFSILNYVTRGNVLLEEEENEAESEDEDNLAPSFYETKQPSFHCNWQLTYELSLTPEWQQLDALTQQPFLEREGILKLLQLRDYFIEPDEEFEENLSYRETELRTFLPRVMEVDATLATDDEMVRLMLSEEDMKQNLLINFAIAVHAGCIVLEALVLIERKGANIVFNLINREQLMLSSAKSGIAKIRTNLGDTFPVFDTDLNNHSDLNG